ncbi:MAG: response regulator [bacterium]|nr:response regulator [bacterium]
MIDIILVESDEVLAATYRRGLQRVGYTVACYSNAQTAIAGVDKQKPKLIILELNLHHHNGVEFIHEIRSYDDLSEIPIVLLTGIPASELDLGQDQMEILGIKEILYKPSTTIRELIQTAKKQI